MKLDGNEIHLIGHPFSALGMSEHVRSSFRALSSLGISPHVFDIFKLSNPQEKDLIGFHEVRNQIFNNNSKIDIFHINGDEVADTLDSLKKQKKRLAYKIIYPAWELPNYPQQWATELDKFDEIWAPSKFIETALKAACTKPVLQMPLACEAKIKHFLAPKYFGLPESKYKFLFFYDLRSYTARKNPQAVLQAFKQTLKTTTLYKPYLVLKLNGAQENLEHRAELLDLADDFKENITIIDRVMSDNEIKNLINCCECFISLHRSEGFGRGIAEAMYLGKPVIATGWSGNLDFMQKNNSLSVEFNMVKLEPGAYPHWEGQFWADPDIEQAASLMVKLLNNPEFGRNLGRKARIHMVGEFSYRAIGLNYYQRLCQLFKNI